MSRPFDDILDECIARLLGGERLEDCLARFPDEATDLEPLLRMAALTASAAVIAPRPGFRAEARRRLIARLGDQRTAPWWRRSHRRALFAPRSLASAAAALLLVALSSGAVVASAGSLPGEPLYGVKLAAEQARLLAAGDDEARAELHVELAGRRLEEVEQVLARRGSVDVPTIEAAAQEADRAVEIAESRRPAAREPILNRVAEVTARQQQVLANVIDRAPPAARPGLERALEASRRGHEKATRGLGDSPPVPARATPTATTTSTERAGRSDEPRPAEEKGFGAKDGGARDVGAPVQAGDRGVGTPKPSPSAKPNEREERPVEQAKPGNPSGQQTPSDPRGEGKRGD